MKKHLLLLMVLCSIMSTYSQTVGTLQNDHTASNGYHLISPLNYNTTFLIDNCGQVINKWQSNYLPGVNALLADDGTLYRAGNIPGLVLSSGGQGGRIEQFDWDGNLIWYFELADSNQRLHHDFELLPNGNILAICWERKTYSEVIQAGRDPGSLTGTELWTDKIIEIQPTGSVGGTIVWEWDFWDHLIQDYDSGVDNYGVIADHPELLDINKGQTVGDWLHCNALDYNARLDQIVICSPELNEFFIIDHSTNTVEAASSFGGNAGHGGDFLYRWGNPENYNQGTVGDRQLFYQHDVHWIHDSLKDGGKLMVFNNAQNDGLMDFSTVNIIAPDTTALGDYFINLNGVFGPTGFDWNYQLPEPLTSNILSGARRLANGNTIICSGRRGTLIEIDSLENIVWHYRLPISNTGPIAQGDSDQPQFLFNIKKYGPDFSGFAGKDLTAGPKIELNPLDDCTLSVLNVEIDNPTNLLDLLIYPNPANDLLVISSAKKLSDIYLEIRDMTGKVVATDTIIDAFLVFIKTHELANGAYVLYTESNEMTVLKKFIVQH